MFEYPFQMISVRWRICSHELTVDFWEGGWRTSG